ncbi:MAG: SDR family oxidoreductase [Actinobacteria bacterium]|nr:SDR family oxidoreductase [Actinomycetota bacterium]
MPDDATRTVLVTGAGGGLGRAMCEEFAREGYRVLAVDLDEETAQGGVDAAAALGGPAAGFACDVTDPESVARLGRWATEEQGGVDAVINNAGIFEGFLDIDTITPERWDAVVAVNLTGPFLVSRELVPSLTERGGGAIINIASIAGMVGGAGGIAYTTTKHGVIGLTRELAYNCGERGIRVNAIAPGVIEAGVSLPLLNDPSRSADMTAKMQEVPARRLGNAREVARLAVYLAGDDAAFVQGAVLPIDGGFTAV